MPAVNLAFVWHQHQPYYPDRIGGENPMPWVRLHGTKDYWGMAWHIKEVPEFRCTINLVPSLLEQLIAYTDGGASDRHLDVSRTPADGLSEADTRFLLDQFFMANYDNMIRAMRSCIRSGRPTAIRSSERSSGSPSATCATSKFGATSRGSIRCCLISTRT